MYVTCIYFLFICIYVYMFTCIYIRIDQRCCNPPQYVRWRSPASNSANRLNRRTTGIRNVQERWIQDSRQPAVCTGNFRTFNSIKDAKGIGKLDRLVQQSKPFTPLHSPGVLGPDYDEEARKLFALLNLPPSGAANDESSKFHSPKLSFFNRNCFFYMSTVWCANVVQRASRLPQLGCCLEAPNHRRSSLHWKCHCQQLATNSGHVRPRPQEAFCVSFSIQSLPLFYTEKM